jgi:hypothetical protein
MGVSYNNDGLGSLRVDERVQALENQLEALLADSVEDELVVREVAVAPRSKLRVACE